MAQFLSAKVFYQITSTLLFLNGLCQTACKVIYACTMHYSNFYIGYFQLAQPKLDLPLCPDKQGAYNLFLYIQAERGPYQFWKWTL